MRSRPRPAPGPARAAAPVAAPYGVPAASAGDIVGDARRLDRHRLAAGERREVVGRRDGSEPDVVQVDVVDLGDEGIVERAGRAATGTPPTGSGSRTTRQAGSGAPAGTGAAERDLQDGQVLRRRVPRSECRPPPSSASGTTPGGRADRPRSRHRSRARGTPRRPAGNGDSRSQRRRVPTGLPLGGTDRICSRPCRSRCDRPAGTSRDHRGRAGGGGAGVACVGIGVIVAPAGAAATASKAAATSPAPGATAPRVRLPTRPPENRRIRATPRPRDAYCLGARRLREPPRHFFPALLLAARPARAR